MKRCMALVLGCVLAFSLGAQQLVVVRDNVDYPPLEYHEGGKLTGFHVELVEAAAKAAGMTIKWEEVPWSRAINAVETGTADAITYCSFSSEREKFMVFNEPNALSRPYFCFITRSDSNLPYDGDVAKLLKSRALLRIRGFEIEEIKPYLVSSVEAQNMPMFVDMLLGKRAEVGIINKGDFLSTYGSKPEASKVKLLEPGIVGSPAYIAFSKAKTSAAVLNKFTAAMEAYKKTAAYTQLKKKYNQ